MEFAILECGRTQEGGGEGIQQIRVGRAGRTTADQRSQQDACRRCAQTCRDIGNDLDAVDTRMPERRAASTPPPTAWNPCWPRSVRLTSSQSISKTTNEMMMLLGMPMERLRAIAVKDLGTPDAIGTPVEYEGQPHQNAADTQGGNDRVHFYLRHNCAVDDAYNNTDAQHKYDCQPNRQPLFHHQPSHQYARKRAVVANAEVHFAHNQHHRQPTRNNSRQRRRSEY